MIFDNKFYEEDLKYISETSIDWELLQNKTILITGITGMIGSLFADALIYRNKNFNSNIKIKGISRNKVKAMNKLNDEYIEFIECDVNDHIPDTATADYIIHCASNTHPKAYTEDPIGTITTNIIGTNNILSKAVQWNTKRVLFASSVEIYGDNRTNNKFSENDCGYINCNTLRAGYNESKRAGEALCQAYIEKYEQDIVIPRICRVYGPTMSSSDSKASAQFIRNAINKEDIILKSNGEQFFSYIYAADVVSALLVLLLKGIKGEAYNIATENSNVHLKDFAMIVSKIVGTQVKFDLPNEQEKKGLSEIITAVLNVDKISSLGWNGKYDIKEGIKRTIDILTI